ncbi:MAG: 2OG-Fe(II) oxygenase [Gammaproteobacteria bacterium]
MPPELNFEKITDTIFSSFISGNQKLNSLIFKKFKSFKDHDNTRKSHFFEGRHENIYIATDLIEELQTVLSHCAQCVTHITGVESLKSGLWFNYMEPGHVTLPHSHDENDEIYSAVYYVKVPKDSGNLIITENSEDILIKPIDGMLVLFPPELVHCVTKNESNEARLSLGINIGTSS